MNQRSPSPFTLLLTYFALLLLLAASVVVAQLETGGGEFLATITIAAAKTGLVAIVFMQLRHESNITRVFASAGLLWLAVLIGLTFTDVLTRDY